MKQSIFIRSQIYEYIGRHDKTNIYLSIWSLDIFRLLKIHDGNNSGQNFVMEDHIDNLKGR